MDYLEDMGVIGTLVNVSWHLLFKLGNHTQKRVRKHSLDFLYSDFIREKQEYTEELAHHPHL